MQLQSSHELTNLNTLRLKSVARDFVILDDVNDLPLLADFIVKHQCHFFVLGGGSNLVLPEIYNGLVIHNQLRGIEQLENAVCENVVHENAVRVQEMHENIVRENEASVQDVCAKNVAHPEHVLIKAMAGETWDDFVAHCLDHGWFGLENLSLIPGTVGAAPIQNIGAYGVEVKDFIESVEVYDIATRQMWILNNSDCAFSYRNSRFKTDANLIVVAVTFRLLKTSRLNVKYGDVAKQLETIKHPSAEDVRNCVIKIRQSKLPDPNIIANVGSFFHNPIVTNDVVLNLQARYPHLPVYAVDEHRSKVSAGWLIDNLGLKGYRLGNMGVYAKQALVLVNYADATQVEVLAFAKTIQEKVMAAYQVALNIEPIIMVATMDN